MRLALATFFWTGLAPFAPGTCGSLGAYALHLGLIAGGHGDALTALAIAAAATVLGVPLGAWSQAHFGRPDPGPFVMDEVAGYFLAASIVGGGVLGASLSLVLFRVFDIVKPTPVRQLESLPGGWGIVADDLMAGLMAGGLGWGVLTLVTSGH